jgi:tripartite motif-containing protein 71
MTATEPSSNMTAVEPSGNMTATPRNQQNINQSNNYQFVRKWGSYGDLYNGGANNGEFNEPIGVAVDSSGNVYVADFLNHRIQVFAPQK